MDLKESREAIFQTLFDEVREAISRAYLPGAMAYVREQHKEFYERILKTETTLNELW